MTQKPSTRGPCPYCGASGPYQGREHVIPRAFGSFERNLIAWDVCDTCNEYFGRTLDQVLARDTYEGYLRFHAGVKPTATFKPLRDRRRVRTFGRSGPWKGMELQPRFDEAMGEIVQEPVAQVGFAKSPEDEPTYYPADALPDPDEVKALLGVGEYFMRAIGFDSVDAVNVALADAGFTEFRHVGRDGEVPTPGTTIRVSRRIKADRIVLRAIAKIAVNYLIAQCPTMARMPQFRALKDYIRHDRDPGYAVSAPNPESAIANQPEGKRIVGHVLTLRYDANRRLIRASVSLFNQMRYDVTLSSTRLLVDVPPEFMTTGHLFDTTNRTVLHLTHKSQLADRLTLRGT